MFCIIADDDYDDDYDDDDKMETSLQETKAVTPPKETTAITSTPPTKTDSSSFTGMNWMSQSTVQTSNTATEQDSVHGSIQVTESESSEGVSDTIPVEGPPPLLGGMSLEQLQAKVKEMFPGFTTNGILRFSSLLGPGKQSSMPRLWEGCRKPKRKTIPPDDYKDPNEWTFNFAPPPSDDMLDNDDVDFMAPVDSSGRQVGTKGDNVTIVVDEQTSEWRFGPARYWYDLFGFPEDGRGFDYGFKTKVVYMYVMS